MVILHHTVLSPTYDGSLDDVSACQIVFDNVRMAGEIKRGRADPNIDRAGIANPGKLLVNVSMGVYKG